MNKQFEAVPTAHIAINKSRIRIYNKDSEIPSVYLKKSQEFQIELFNPTTDVILCEIHLNNKRISQGGLVLNPGQRVFLDRYLDVAKKFLFETYEVSNSEEVKEAIANNGDFKVKFYREDTYVAPTLEFNRYNWGTGRGYGYNNIYLGSSGLSNSGIVGTTTSNSCTFTCNVDNMTYTTAASGEFLSCSTDDMNEPRKKLLRRSKSIETGRVEKGSDSEQKLSNVSKKWEYSPFHTIEYKLLPISQKVVESSDLNIKRYCGSCGHKHGKTDNFCSSCGTKI